jgi:hypothetical protein
VGRADGKIKRKLGCNRQCHGVCDLLPQLQGGRLQPDCSRVSAFGPGGGGESRAGGESVDPANINLQGTTENIISSSFNNVYTGPGCPAGTPTCDGLPTMLDGNELPNAPEFSVNIGIGYAWFTELWGRNLKDDDYVTGQVPGDQNVGIATNQILLEPRTYGISVGYNFQQW